jgi:pimeloyl-ACP methyl ester carboxylesterase
MKTGFKYHLIKRGVKMNKSIYRSETGKKQILEFYNNALENLPVKTEKINIPTRFGNTFVLACGDRDKPPLVLLHGTAANSAVWFGDIKEYSKYFRTYAVDITGEPGNSSEARPDLGNSYSDWLNEIFEFLEIKRSNLIGMSLGGWISGRFAIDNSEKLIKLVLLCPSGISPVKRSFLLRAFPLMFLGDYGLRKINKIIYHKETVHEEMEKFSRLINKSFKTRIVVPPIFSDSEISKINIPVYLIVGEKDALVHSVQTVERIERILPNSQIELRKDVGHVLLNTSENIIRFLLK